MMKKLISLLLVVVMVLSLAACKKSGGNETTAPAGTQGGSGSTESTSGGEEPTNPPEVYEGPDWDAISEMDYETASETLYDLNLAEFAEYYAKAKAELDNTDLRLALMALAEAKMYEAGVFLPIQTDGGNYAMSRVVPHTITSTTWGNDNDRNHSMLICTNPIKSEDRAALTEIWSAASDNSDWYAKAKAYLSEHGYTLTNTYGYAYSDEIATWDTIATSYASDSEFIAPTYSPLLEYDAKDNQQPALAESVDVSDDGTVFTFHLRHGVKWVDQQGREVAEVKADDFVASMQHLTDNMDGSGYLMTASEGCGIKNFEQYVNGEITDFAEVGIKALDDYTVEYTLEQKFPAFLTMVGYGVFAPLNRDYYKSQGGTFGLLDGVEYTSGNYGIDPSHILYCGPYLITNYTQNVTIRYEANPTYWAKDVENNRNLETMVYYYDDNSEITRGYNEFKDGTRAGCGLSASTLELAQSEKPDGEDKTYFELYNYIAGSSGSTFCGWYNINRKAFTNWNDETKGVSPKKDSEEEQTRTRDAMSNAHFRLALTFALDRGAYNSVLVGEDLKYARLVNTYTPGDFQRLTADVTVSVNGKDTTFKAGTYYGAMIQAQLDADGVPIKAWDPTGNDGLGSSASFDGWFNADNAKAELNKAIEELAQIGVEISADKPIYIDYPYGSYSENSTKQANAYKQSIEKYLEGKVIVNLIAFEDGPTLQYSYYRLRDGQDANFDVSTGSGWGPDYGDAQTFLDTIQAGGYMLKNMGMW